MILQALKVARGSRTAPRVQQILQHQVKVGAAIAHRHPRLQLGPERRQCRHHHFVRSEIVRGQDMLQITRVLRHVAVIPEEQRSYCRMIVDISGSGLVRVVLLKYLSGFARYHHMHRVTTVRSAALDPLCFPQRLCGGHVLRERQTLAFHSTLVRGCRKQRSCKHTHLLVMSRK